MPNPASTTANRLTVRFDDGLVVEIKIDHERLIFGPASLGEEHVQTLSRWAPAERCLVDRRWRVTQMVRSIRAHGGYAWPADGAYELLDHEAIGSSYFFPRREPLEDALLVSTHDGQTLSCWRSAPPSDRPVLLFFHGNGELASDWVGLLGPMANALGMDAFLAEYRGYGVSTGRPQLASMLDDVTAIVKATGVPPEQLVVMGRSVGSLYAIEAVDRFAGVRGLILESGIHDVLERLLLRVEPRRLGCSGDEFRDAVRSAVDHEAKLGRYEGPLLVLHAEQDHLVRIRHAEQNLAAASSDQKRLVRFPRGDHNSILMENQRAYVEELAQFVAAL